MQVGCVTGAGIAMLAVLVGTAHAGGLDDDAGRAARWREVRTALFGSAAFVPGEPLIAIDAPARALDASLVPITLTLKTPGQVKALDLVIDDNPAPHAAHLVFGPGVDASAVTLRVRIDGYTNLHAVATLNDGRLAEVARFIKASGGCSAPIGVSDEQAMAGMGMMKVRFNPAVAGPAMTTTLMIKHPNFSGMQMNQITRLYTPARFVQRVTVTQGGRSVLALDGDISLSSDPVIGFTLVPQGTGPMSVVVTDNQNGRWVRTFDLPGRTG
ncbi:MAG TPA: quinoprotein dehydrogenase-associated SoxYZ-like carrier [Sphingomonas sp.]|jgi:sulfur-oxidizing protein SoxY|uniref:quinoprotein dehydrogenase-associated SoxYZ-like carrier n=1 Tax=Sphingomonas sp. TaxID=28214 RepID=UPI002EDA72CB